MTSVSNPSVPHRLLGAQTLSEPASTRKHDEIAAGAAPTQISRTSSKSVRNTDTVSRKTATLLQSDVQASVRMGQRSVSHGPLFARHLQVSKKDSNAAESSNSNAVGSASTPSASKLASLLVAAPAGASAKAEAAPEKLNGFQRFWRDFGINPVAMFKRAFIDQEPDDGVKLEGGHPADPLAMEAFGSEMRSIIDKLDIGHDGRLDDADVSAFKLQLQKAAGRYGVKLVFKEGAPTVAWGDIPRLEIMDPGDISAAHELVHAVQCAIGGVAALTTAAADKIRADKGRAPRDISEIQAAISQLSDAEKKAAFADVVRPMEKQAYAKFEEGAFQSTGMFGKKARDVAYYQKGLKENVDAYVDAYEHAMAPVMDEDNDAKVYGSIAHIARTHGETALLLASSGAAYAKVASLAMALNPIAGVVALLPLAYMSWRSVMG